MIDRITDIGSRISFIFIILLPLVELLLIGFISKIIPKLNQESMPLKSLNIIYHVFIFILLNDRAKTVGSWHTIFQFLLKLEY